MMPLAIAETLFEILQIKRVYGSAPYQICMDDPAPQIAG